MARLESHISTSVLIGLAYSATGVLVLDTKLEHAFLAAIIFVLAGVLPNVDAKGELPAKEMTGVLAAVAPVALMQIFPVFQQGGLSRKALVIIVSYMTARFLTNWVLERYVVRRGMLHSVPAAAISFEAVYLLFRDLIWFDRLYLAFAAFLGFMIHLLMDGYGNIDLVNKAMGKAEKKPKVMKFFARSWGSTAAIYSVIAVLGWFMASNLAPQLKIFAGVAY